MRKVDLMEEEKYFKDEGELENMARELIGMYHSEAATARVFYFFKTKHRKKGDKAVLGTCSLLNEKMQLMCPYDYCLEIADDAWQQLNETQRKALLLHELKHIQVVEGEDGETKYRLRLHDLEEFSQVVKIFGLWKPDIVEFSKALEGKQELKQEIQESKPKRTLRR